MTRFYRHVRFGIAETGLNVQLQTPQIHIASHARSRFAEAQSIRVREELCAKEYLIALLAERKSPL